MISAVIFTCTRDAALAAVAAARLQACGVAVTYAIDAAESATFPAAPEGVRLVTTSFRRNGNLNGRGCVLGILSELAAALTADSSDWVLKVDSDTIVSPRFLAFLGETESAAIGSRFPNRDWCGAVYAIRADFLPAVAAAAERLPEGVRHMEDQTIGRLVRLAGKSSTVPLGWYDNAKNEPSATPYEAVTFSFRHGFDLTAFPTQADRLAETARRMAAYEFPAPL